MLGVDELNELIEYFGFVTVQLARRRTGLTSPLIPVREYIALSSIETWRRWPEILRRLDEVVGAEELGRRFRVPGHGVSAPYFWAIPGLTLSGREFLSYLGTVGDDEHERLDTIFDFWLRTTGAWRDDGFLQCWDAGDVVRPYPPDVLEPIVEAAVNVHGDEKRSAEVRRFLATTMQFLFLLYLDTRMGTGDSGPYPLPGGRTMVVREFTGLSRSWIPWSDVVADVPWNDLVCGLVFRPGVQNRVTDFATVISVPVDNLQLLEAFSVLRPDGHGGFVPLSLDELPGILDVVKGAQKDFYRRVASWTWEEKLFAGAYVYVHGLVRPWTVAAGIDGEIDWTVPRDSTEVVPLLEHMPIDEEINPPLYRPFEPKG